jgi:FMN phosphatase YigB (HAD superfamily)
MIKGILLDYGGTIDTNGLHWAVVLKNSYLKCGIELPEDLFNKAYSFGEKSLAINPLVKPSHTFLDVLRLKIEQQFIFLSDNGHLIDNIKIAAIANDCNLFAKNTVDAAVPVLEELSKDFPMIIVSNFYGNLNTVLEDFGIRKYFRNVVESAVVGIRKPDPAIYQYGVALFGFAAAECVVIGDSFSKDMIPAKKTGCKTVWLNAAGWEKDGPKDGEERADAEIKDFSKLPGVIKAW